MKYVPGWQRRTFEPESIRKIAFSTMRANFLVLRTLGRTSARSPEELYGCTPEQVIDIHLRDPRLGGGLWYRLSDGRMIDAAGRPSRPCPEAYIESVH